jgi:acyl carrier protein
VTRKWSKHELVECVLRTIRALLRVGDDFTSETDLLAYGLDSLRLAELLLALEEETGIWIDERLLTPENLANAERLAACVYEQMSGAGA